MASPRVRYETTVLTLADNEGPVFPNPLGTATYSYPLQNPKYIHTERGHGTTSVRWRVENCNSTDHTSIWTMWNTTLERGKLDATLVDMRQRMLFDATWNWGERWKKLRGGVTDIMMDFVSPFPWTPPLWAFYGSIRNILAEHTTGSNTLTLGTGTMQLQSGDANVLRANGYALRLPEDAGASNGASTSGLNWQPRSTNPGISLVCQFRVPDLSASKELDIMRLSDGSNTLRIYAERNGVDTFDLTWAWTKAGQVEETINTTALSADTWYDVALAFDGQNGEYHGYFDTVADPTANWATTDVFLNGATALTDGIVSDTAPTNYPENITWDELQLLRHTAGDIFVTDTDYAYIQNIWFVDDFISPLEFDTMRRWHHMWNGKTGLHPK